MFRQVRQNPMALRLADPQLVGPLERGAADTANHSVAITANQWVRDGPGAVGTVKVERRILVGHAELGSSKNLGPKRKWFQVT
jgi:hypothetical protein